MTQNRANVTGSPGGSVGVYADAEGDAGVLRGCMLADTLAWAVTHGIPLPEALASRTFRARIPAPRGRLARPIRRLIGLPVRLPGTGGVLRDTRRSWRLRWLVEDLEKGEPLSAALQRNVSKEFPPYYFAAVAKAERDRNLDIALPRLAHQLRFAGSVASDRKAALQFVVVKLIVASLLVSFSITFVAPRIRAIAEYYRAGSAFDWARMLGALGPLTVILVFATWGLCLLAATEGVGEYVVLAIPGIGRERRRFLQCELAWSMAAFLRQGEDLVGAAEWSRSATGSAWMRRKLDTFLGALRGGANWVDAWKRMKVGTPLDEWVLRNAASREDPASGFEFMGEWMHHQIHARTRWIERWLDPIFTVMLAGVVGLLAYQVFSALAGILYSLAEKA